MKTLGGADGRVFAMFQFDAGYEPVVLGKTMFLPSMITESVTALDTATGEACDDGNTADGDGCSSTCLVETACGNGTIEGVEYICRRDSDEGKDKGEGRLHGGFTSEFFFYLELE